MKALSLNYEFFCKNPQISIIITLAMAAITLIGALLLGVGIFLTVPVAFLTLLLAYRSLREEIEIES